MRTFVLGDVHGRIEALKEVLEKSKFKYKKDKLIVLGDIVDGGYDTYQVVEKLLKIKKLVFIIGNHDCADKDTECLTKRGWLKYNEIKADDKIYSYDVKTDTGVWTNINKKIIKHYKGKMVSWKSQHIDMLVTPSHRIFHKQKQNKKTKKYSNYTLAKDAIGSYLMYTSVSEKLEEYNISDDMIKLCAWILTDGSVSKNKNYNGKIIYQSKPKYVKEIKTLLKNLNIKYTERVSKRKTTHICGKELKSTIGKTYDFYILSKSGKNIPVKEKYVLPDWVYKLSDRQTDIFVTGLIKGDGTFYGKAIYALYGREDFLIIIRDFLITRNYRVTISKGYPTYAGGIWKRLNITKKNTSILVVCEHKKNKIISRIKYKDYDDIVWCLNVPLSNFMVKRNNKCYFTGNCWFINHIKSGWAEEIWLSQGGANTLRSYGGVVIDVPTMHEKVHVVARNVNVPVTHQEFFNKGQYYYTNRKMIFVHGGFKPNVDLKNTEKELLIWDRDLIEFAKKQPVPGYDKIFIGHTNTQTQGDNPLIKECLKPIWYNNLCMMDTGAGGSGKLSILNINTHELWQSKIQKFAR